MPQDEQLTPDQMFQRSLARFSGDPKPEGEGKPAASPPAPPAEGEKQLTPDQMFQQSLKTRKDRSTATGVLKSDIKQGVKDIAGGVAAGPPSSMMRGADLLRRASANASPAYKKQLEQASKNYANPPATLPISGFDLTVAKYFPWYRDFLDEAKKKYAASSPEDRRRLFLVPGYFSEAPEIKKAATPPQSAEGKAAFRAEQAGEQVGALALGEAVAPLEGASWLWRLARMLRGAGIAGAGATLQTGDPGEFKSGAAWGAGGQLLTEIGEFLAPQFARKELFGKAKGAGGAAAKSGAEVSEQAQKEAAQQYTAGWRRPKLAEVEQQVKSGQQAIEDLTKTHPDRAMAIDDVLAPVKKRIAELEKEGTPAATKEAKALTGKLDEWAKDLGYEAPKAATRTASKITGPQGQTLYNTAAGSAGRTTTTAADVSRWAKSLTGEGAEAGTAAARSAIAKMIPEGAAKIKSLERDEALKGAVVKLLKSEKGKDWWEKAKKTGIFWGTSYGLDALTRFLEKHEEPGAKGTRLAQLATAAAGIVEWVKGNPAGMTTLMMALKNAGIEAPTAMYTLFPRDEDKESGPGGPEEPKGRAQWEGPAPANRPAMKPVAAPAAKPIEAYPGASEWEGPAPAKSAAPEKKGALRITPEMRQTFQAAGRANGVVPSVLMGMMKVESGGNPRAKSGKGATGLMQFMPATARQYGIDPTNWKQSIEGAARYMGQMLRKYDGNIRLALAAYNAGPGAVDRHKGVPPYKETQAYVNKVLAAARTTEA